MPPAARGSFRQPLNADGCRPRTDEVADHHRGLWPATVMTGHAREYRGPRQSRIWASEQSMKRLIFRFLSKSHLGECLGDEMATVLASRDNVRQMTPCGGLLRRSTIPAFHRKRSPF